MLSDQRLSASQRPLAWIIERVSGPISVVLWVNRHRTLRNVLLFIFLVSFSIVHFLGWEILFLLLSYLFRIAFVVVFIVVQFVAMFWFLARGNETEHYPGDKGMVTFEDDYFGNVNEVSLVQHWTKLLTADRQLLDDMGAKTISGILMAGPPGVGKTLMAKCLASASGAAFFALSATSLQAMFIGIGPLKVMRLVSKARKAARQYGAAIIFMDEIDAVGGSRGMVEQMLALEGEERKEAIRQLMETQAAIEAERQRMMAISPIHRLMMGAGMGGGGLGVLSTLLVEMDGVTKLKIRDEVVDTLRGWFGLPPVDPGVVLFMGATNRPAVLDPALTRPGRFDRTIRIGLPDASTRRALFEGYLRKVKHEEDLDIDVLVDITGGVSHAFIASSIEKDAARLAIFDGRKLISQHDIEQAIEENVVGLPNPIDDLDPEQEYQIAVHEAGHAVAAWAVRPERRIANVSIIRRGSGILGYVRDVEKKEVFAMPLSRVSANIMVSLAGHLAVELVLGEPWTGAGSDFRHVKGYMRFLREHGEFGAIPINENNSLMWERINKREDDYMQRTIKGTRALLEKNKDKLFELADSLVEHKELSSEEVYALLGAPPEEVTT